MKWAVKVIDYNPLSVYNINLWNKSKDGFWWAWCDNQKLYTDINEAYRAIQNINYGDLKYFVEEFKEEI